MTTSADASDRALFEVYYPPFVAAIDAGAASFMCAYNRVNGSHACGSERLLTTHLRGALGFRGWVMSDWWALHSSGAASAGVDQAMPGNDGYFDREKLAALPEAEELQIKMATRVVRGMLSSGAWNTSACTAGCDCKPLLYDANATSDAHVQLARRVAAASAVLLKNDPIYSEHFEQAERALPLRRGARVALVGSACGAPHSIDVESVDWAAGDYYVVGGSGRVVSDRAVTIRAALERRGVSLVVSSSDRLGEALAAAANADVVLACGSGVTRESEDRRTLRLDQHELLTGLAQAASTGELAVPYVVAVMAPGQVAAAPWSDWAHAVVAMFLAGQETGNAWADVLLGDVNPSGKLPVTFPREDADATPPCRSGGRCVYSEGLHYGWRGMLARPERVAFAFGAGLSYTSFEYSWGALPVRDVVEGTTALAVDVRNGGGVAGAEVVQLYVRYPEAADEPPLVLKGFAKTRVLQPGESQTLSLTLSARQLMIWDGEWRAVSGSFGLIVGSDSTDVRLEAELVVP